MSFVELALITTMSVSTPFSSDQMVVPSMTFQKEIPMLYFKMKTSARCFPGNVVRWNPETVKWVVEGGVHYKEWRIGVGHQSEHGVDFDHDLVESYDYLRAAYRQEL